MTTSCVKCATTTAECEVDDTISSSEVLRIEFYLCGNFVGTYQFAIMKFFMK